MMSRQLLNYLNIYMKIPILWIGWPKIQSLVTIEWFYFFYSYEQINNRFQFRYHNISLNHPKKIHTLFPRIFPATTCLCEQCWGSNKSCWAPSRHNARCQSDIRPTSRWPRSTNTAGLGVSKYIHIQMCRCVDIYIYICVCVYMYM